MKITILTGCFYPQIHPRAFRATELAKEFVRQGHIVSVVNLRTMEGFDYDKYAKENHIKITNLDVFADRMAALAAKKQTYSWFGKVKRFCLDYFLNGRLFKYGYEIKKKLHEHECLKDADLVIALSTPFPCHYGYAKYVRKYGRNFITILDSGDPFYYSKQSKHAIWFKYIERNVYRQCDFLTIPTSNAIPLYTPVIPEEKIHIIPQGFNMKDLKLYNGSFKSPVRFAYAGVFYWDIRNPEFLFDYLDKASWNFEFHIYMRFKDAHLEDILTQYPNLSKKIRLQYGKPHDELISELSRMHFLINIENLSNTQMPSKLIDYGMTKRPIFSCKKDTFSADTFESFMRGDYSGQYTINMSDYDIENVANKFLALAEQVRK